MPRTFQITVPDEIGAEIEQYVYGKTGKNPAHWLSDAALVTMSKKPADSHAIQADRVEVRGRDIDAPKPLSATARG